MLLAGLNVRAVLTDDPRRVIRRCLGVLSLLCSLSGVASAGELINLSTRGFVGTGDNVLIGGLVIEGDSTTVIVRAPGPSLSAFGVTGVLVNPTLQIFSGQTSIAFNDDWQTSPQAAAIAASGFAPSDPLEPAILITLGPGPYTAIVRGANGSTGVALVEIFLLQQGDFSGTWAIDTNKTSDTCNIPLVSVRDTLTVNQNGTNLTANLPGNILLSGTVDASGQFTLEQTNPQQATSGTCTFEVAVSLSGNFSKGAATATLHRGQVSGSCPPGVDCAAVFDGTITKIGSLQGGALGEQGVDGSGSSVSDAVIDLLGRSGLR